MPALAFEARISGVVGLRKMPGGVLLESATSKIVCLGPHEPTVEIPSLVLICDEVIEAILAFAATRATPLSKSTVEMVSGEQLE